MNTRDILALPLKANDADAPTIGAYLKALLQGVWTEEEGSDGKRPFGNSGWKSSIEIALITAKIVEGKIDEDGYIEYSNKQQTNTIILNCIEEIFK